MPCKSDYLEPNKMEIELSYVLAILDELSTGKIQKTYKNGNDPRVYNNTTKEILDNKTAELCSKLQNISDITKYSLELQIWWRDHQNADKKRIQDELKEIKLKKDRDIALSKLTPYERKLLGL